MMCLLQLLSVVLLVTGPSLCWNIIVQSTHNYCCQRSTYSWRWLSWRNSLSPTITTWWTPWTVLLFSLNIFLYISHIKSINSIDLFPTRKTPTINSNNGHPSIHPAIHCIYPWPSICINPFHRPSSWLHVTVYGIHRMISVLSVRISRPRRFPPPPLLWLFLINDLYHSGSWRWSPDAALVSLRLKPPPLLPTDKCFLWHQTIYSWF